MGKAKRNRERRRSVATEISSEATTSRRRSAERTVITPGGLEMSEGLARLAGIELSEDADR